MENIKKTIISKLYELSQKTDSLADFKAALRQAKLQYYQWKARQTLFNHINTLSSKGQDTEDYSDLMADVESLFSGLDRIISELEAS